jgi:hypothetical protein
MALVLFIPKRYPRVNGAAPTDPEAGLVDLSPGGPVRELARQAKVLGVEVEYEVSSSRQAARASA